MRESTTVSIGNSAIDLAVSAGVRLRQPVRFGLPFPQGVFRSLPGCQVRRGSQASRAQSSVLSRWPDGSVRWCAFDAVLMASSASDDDWRLTLDHPPPTAAQLHTASGDTASGDRSRRLLSWLVRHCWRLIDHRNRSHTPGFPSPTEVIADGPVVTRLRQQAVIPKLRGLRLVVDWAIYHELELVGCDVTLHNRRRARHRGGIWDLGDQGSHFFRQFCFDLPLANADTPVSPTTMTLAVDDQADPIIARHRIGLYQDSSGGANWQGRNHLDRQGRVSTRFCGYRLSVDDQTHDGRRASPSLRYRGAGVDLAVAVPEFWQQFPMSLSADAQGIRIGLFPGEAAGPHELQGGEQKTHRFWIQRLGATDATVAERHGDSDASDGSPLAWVHRPAVIAPTADYLHQCGVIEPLQSADGPATDALETVLNEAIQGPRSIFARRERQDEYGWRNYGDTVADHEGEYYRGDEEFVSHYNNQFDVLLGFLKQFLRTGDRHWFELAQPLARHVADIDIYHTTEDRPVYNGGLFWFTDHYLTAHTCTHRSYSRDNRPSGADYGGGPGAEHNFAEGLLLYHHLTGCPRARNAVLSLADWVISREDGRRSLLGVLDDGPTGKAASDKILPSRGAANSISVLLDGWWLSGDERYVELCEQLIRRCIHPQDEIDRLDLLDIERNWSYTMFLTSMEKYLQAMEAAGRCGWTYQYARAALLHYARWMLDHERPYFDQREKMEYPTETWAGQEFRKANVFRRAAPYSDAPLRQRLLEAGDRFGNRAWDDLMRFTQTRTTIRALALVMNEGLADCVWRGREVEPSEVVEQIFQWGERAEFWPVRQRIMAQARSVHGLAGLTRRVATPTRWATWWQARL